MPKSRLKRPFPFAPHYLRKVVAGCSIPGVVREGPGAPSFADLQRWECPGLSVELLLLHLFFRVPHARILSVGLLHSWGRCLLRPLALTLAEGRLPNPRVQLLAQVSGPAFSPDLFL